MTIDTLNTLFNLYKMLLVEGKIDSIDFDLLSEALLQTAQSETLRIELTKEVMQDGNNS